MNRQANVHSIDALRQFRAAVVAFAETVQEVLDILALESQRTVEWVRHDRSAYWRRQVRLAEQRLASAQDQLQNKTLTIDGRDRPAATEEKQAVHRARQRLRLAEQKTSRVSQLSGLLQHQADEYRGVLAKLQQLVEMDLPQAVAALDRMTNSLEKYTQIRPDKKP
jgi:outer membrane translocation and assembly module TamA